MATNICVFCGQKPSLFQDTIIPCGDTPQNACKTCGKYEFYNPVIMRKNKHLIYLASKDTQN